MKYSWMICFLCLFGCDNDCEEQNRQKDLTTIRSSYYLSTVVHDEHLFILSRYGYFIHHPDCPCSKKITPKEPNILSPVVIEGLPSVLIK